MFQAFARGCASPDNLRFPSPKNHPVRRPAILLKKVHHQGVPLMLCLCVFVLQ